MKIIGKKIQRSRDTAVLALGAALFMVAAVQLHPAPQAASPSTGTVTVTATLSAFAKSLIKVGTADTATASVTGLSEYNPPISAEDESAVGKGYSWSATVEFSSTANGAYSPAPQGTYTLTLSSGGVDASTVITVTPKVAGYWEVSASCQVTVGQLLAGTFATTITPAATGTPLAWVGTGTTVTEKFTSAIVTFSPNPIETGADKSNPGAIFAAVKATVVPADLTDSVTVNTYAQLPGGTGSAQTSAASRDLANGTISFHVDGLAGTAPTMPNGDVKLEAKDGDTVLGTDLVIVEIPAAIGTPHPTFSGKVTPTNAALSASTVPAWFNPPLPAGDVELVTEATTTLSVPVVNQFGKTLGSEYSGQMIYENGKATNVAVNGGKYPDVVGVLGAEGETTAGSPAERNWLAGNPLAIPNQSYTQNIPVEIAGFTLDPGVVNRAVNYNNGTLTITWP
jgi:hypothetical protein